MDEINGTLIDVCSPPWETRSQRFEHLQLIRAKNKNKNKLIIKDKHDK